MMVSVVGLQGNVKTGEKKITSEERWQKKKAAKEGLAEKAVEAIKAMSPLNEIHNYITGAWPGEPGWRYKEDSFVYVFFKGPSKSSPLWLLLRPPIQRSIGVLYSISACTFYLATNFFQQ